jgi:hypothetical protein
MPAAERGVFRHPGHKPEFTDPDREVAVIIDMKPPEGIVSGWSMRTEFTPRPKSDHSAQVYTDATERRGAGLAHFAEFPPGTDVIDAHAIAVTGPWERIATFDGKTTKELVQNLMVVCSPPVWSESRKEWRFDVMHTADRDQFELRMMARLKNGRMEPLVFHDGPTVGNPAKGFAIVHRGRFDPRDVAEYTVERSPWVRGEIPGIRIKPQR